MLERVVACMAVLAVLVAAAHAAPKAKEAEECPIAGFDLDKIREAARTAPSCDKSLELFRVCASGASSDVALGGVVTEKCEADFLTRLSKRQRRDYDRAQERCANKYRNESGSMYRSFSAFCGAELARNYARRFAKGKTAGHAVPK